MPALCFLAATLLTQQSQKSGLVYGESCAFFIDAPKGWVLDNRQGKIDGLPVVLYRQGSSWRQAETAMYARSVTRDKPSLEDFIQGDCKDFRRRDPKLEIRTLANLKTKDGHVAVLRQFDSEKGKMHDLVAYIALPKAFAMLVLTSRTRGGRDSGEPSFKRLIASFSYFTDKVTIEK